MKDMAISWQDVFWSTVVVTAAWTLAMSPPSLDTPQAGVPACVL